MDDKLPPALMNFSIYNVSTKMVDDLNDETERLGRETLAAADDPAKLNLMGIFYATSGGVRRDALARAFFEKSQKLGDATGLYGLGVMLVKGRGGSCDIARGQEYIRAAADSNEPNAEAGIGAFYMEGKNHFEKNIALGFEYLLKAAQKESSNARRYLNEYLRSNMDQMPVTPATFELCQRLMNAGVPEAEKMIIKIVASSEITPDGPNRSVMRLPGGVIDIGSTVNALN